MWVILTSPAKCFMRTVKIVFLAALAGGLAFFLGFVYFLILLSSYPTSPPALDALPQTDALVLLTGAPGRIEEGIRLLHHHKDLQLFISGVSPKIRRKDLRLLQKLPHRSSELVILGHNASNTHENALEIKQWVMAQSLGAPTKAIQSLCVISSFYHLPRGLLELRAVLPDVSLIPYGVGPHISVWRLLYSHPYYRKHMVQEYMKCIAVLGKRLLTMVLS